VAADDAGVAGVAVGEDAGVEAPLRAEGGAERGRADADPGEAEGDPSGIVASFLRFAFAEAALVESADAPGRTLLVEGAGGGQTWVFGPWSESADAKDDDCGCAVRSRYRDSAAAEEARLDRGEPPLQRFGQAAVDRSLPLPGDAEHQQPSPRAFRRRCTPGLRSSWRCGST